MPCAFSATAIAVAVAGFLEGLGVPWPGEFIIVGAAVTMGNGPMAIPVVTALFTVTYCLGSYLQYLVGSRMGSVVLSWLSHANRSRLERLTARYGLAAVLWTRPLAVGNYVSIYAGMMRMPLLRFVLYTMVGIIPWAAGMTALGWLFGGQIEVVTAVLSKWFIPIGVGLSGVFLLFTVAKIGLRWGTLKESASNQE